MAGKAGRYMSVETGPMAVRKPSSKGSQRGMIVGVVLAGHEGAWQERIRCLGMLLEPSCHLV